MEDIRVPVVADVDLNQTKSPAKKPSIFKNKKLWIISSSIAGVILIGGLFWLFSRPMVTPIATVAPKKTATPTPTTGPSLLNGIIVDASKINQHVIATMIENSPPARPQTGLDKADVVYEALAEGGITRFMALYSQTYPSKAGPIRSARSYYVDWLSEFDAFYIHRGGSPAALDRIRQYNIKDADNADGYYREPQKGVASEHTLYVDVTKLYAWTQNHAHWPSTQDFKPWTFKDPATSTKPSGKITVNFSTDQFKVVWDYDQPSNRYLRNLAGAPHKDKVSGEQLNAQTVVVMTVQRAANSPYKDTGKESEWSMTTIGSGAVSVFEDGARIDGTWKKPSRTERTRFYDSAGQEIVINRGKIWVEVIPQNGSVAQAI